MRQPANSAEIRACFGSVSRNGTEFSTTLFADDATCNAWIEAKKVRIHSGDGFALLTVRERAFERVYHAAADADTLAKALGSLGEPVGEVTAFVADLVGRGAQATALREVYANAGFAPHRCLVRLQRVAKQNPAPNSVSAEHVRFATKGDCPRILEFLEHLLDPLAEQIPDLAGLEAAAVVQNVLVHAVEGDLGGVLHFTVQGKVATLQHWFVDASRKNQGIGSRLMAAFLDKCANCSRILLWVLDDNEDAIAKYRHYGFQHEGLVDHIVVKQKRIN